ncbi:MAG TPA: GtrA family protein [Chthonomonadales bacterium]|nr:GtrA family protein [Chthonomonadales bacterium]
MPTELRKLASLAGPRQFVKFCMVGSSSFAIDFGVSYMLTYGLGLWWVLAKTISFSLAVTNGFFWNRRWTFRAVGHRRKREQYAMFVTFNIVGWALNVCIMKTVFFISTGAWHGQQPERPMFVLATFAATLVVTFWNFFTNKHLTFGRKRTTPDAA